MVYAIDFSKPGLRYLLIIFIPLFIALFFSFFTCFFDIDDLFNRFRMSITALTTMLSYRFIIDRMMPAVGYLTATDQVYIIMLIIALAFFFFQIVINLFVERKIGAQREHRATVLRNAVVLQDIDVALFIALKLLLVGSIGYLLW